MPFRSIRKGLFEDINDTSFEPTLCFCEVFRKGLFPAHDVNTIEF